MLTFILQPHSRVNTENPYPILDLFPDLLMLTGLRNVVVLPAIPTFKCHLQRFQPLLKENREYFLALNALVRASKMRVSRGVWGYAPSGNFANLVSLKWHFLHFDIIFVVFYKVFTLITDIFGFFYAVVNPSFQNQTLRSQNKQFSPCFQNFMINRENLIKIGRVGGNTSNRETPDQIGRVGISAFTETKFFKQLI